jgi:hypothetical protein
MTECPRQTVSATLLKETAVFTWYQAEFLQNLPNPGGTKPDRKSLHSAVVVNFVSSDRALPEGRDRTGWDLWFP